MTKFKDLFEARTSWTFDNKASLQRALKDVSAKMNDNDYDVENMTISANSAAAGKDMTKMLKKFDTV